MHESHQYLNSYSNQQLPAPSLGPWWIDAIQVGDHKESFRDSLLRHGVGRELLESWANHNLKPSIGISPNAMVEPWQMVASALPSSM
jgi:hypothetical protein